MKKIMFDDKYGLTDAVLKRTKTMTRRVITLPDYWNGEWVWGAGPDQDGKTLLLYDADEAVMQDVETGEVGQIMPKYKIGEEVAVAQDYAHVLTEMLNDSNNIENEAFKAFAKFSKTEPYGIWDKAGLGNKMFVKAELMPHRIRITDVKVELLQDISDEDCLKEGVEKWLDCYIVSGIMEKSGRNNVCFDTPREAFASLIDRISGKGTWESNPWVHAYSFDLLKED